MGVQRRDDFVESDVDANDSNAVDFAHQGSHEFRVRVFAAKTRGNGKRGRIFAERFVRFIRERERALRRRADGQHEYGRGVGVRSRERRGMDSTRIETYARGVDGYVRWRRGRVRRNGNVDGRIVAFRFVSSGRGVLLRVLGRRVGYASKSGTDADGFGASVR